MNCQYQLPFRKCFFKGNIPNGVQFQVQNENFGLLQWTNWPISSKDKYSSSDILILMGGCESPYNKLLERRYQAHLIVSRPFNRYQEKLDGKLFCFLGLKEHIFLTYPNYFILSHMCRPLIDFPNPIAFLQKKKKKRKPIAEWVIFQPTIALFITTSTTMRSI